MKNKKTAAKRAQPEIAGEYLIWGNRRMWIGDYSQPTTRAIELACAEVGITDDEGLLAATIDEHVDTMDGAEPVYLRWDL